MACRWVVEAVAAVVLVGDLGEHVRPHERGVLALVADPGGGAEVLRGGVAGHRLLQLDADDERAVVCAGAQVGDGGQGSDAARRAGGFVAGGGGSHSSVVDGGRHRAEVALAGEQLAEGVADVDHVDVARRRRWPRRACRRRPRRSGRRSRGLRGEVAGEVALVAAEDPDVGSGHEGTVLQLRE